MTDLHIAKGFSLPIDYVTKSTAILALLIDAGDRGVTFDALDDATGYKRSSRNTYLQRLRSRELVTTNDGTAYAGAELMESI